jgi:adenylate/nucleoside-diphosphate kinase
MIFRYVLDGYPQTKHQIDLLTERCLIPVRVFELDVKSKEIMVRGTRDRIAASR